MSRWILRMAALAVLPTMFAGCVPKRIVWSPDGKRAAVVIDHRLYLCDPDGTLSGPFADDIAEDTLSPVTWFPNSQRLLVVRREEASRWDAVDAAISKPVRDLIVARATQLHDALRTFNGDWEEFRTDALDELTSGQEDAAILYTRQKIDQDLDQIGENWRKKLENATVTLFTLDVFTVTGGAAELESSIVRVIDGILEVRISPDGKNVAYSGAARETQDSHSLTRAAHDVPDLFVVPSDGNSPPRTVAPVVAWYPDWAQDSRELLFAQPNQPAVEGEELALGTISRRKVADEDGKLLDEFGSIDALAGIVFTPLTKIRALPDGRTLFSAAEVHLPTTAGDMPQRASLFVVDPDRQATITRVTTREAEAHPTMEGLAAGLFDVSPDGTRIAAAHLDGRVSVLDLARGTVISIQDKEEPERGMGAKLRTMPTWRSNEELCLTVPPNSEHGSPGRAEVVLWSKDGVRVLSRNWPSEAADDLLDQSDNTSTDVTSETKPE